MDLAILRSGGANVSHHVTRVSMEVIADDCDGLYIGQPKCTDVVAQMAELGYVPAGPVSCRPHLHRQRQNSACEIEVLFVVAGSGVPIPEYYHYHDLRFNGCRSEYNATPTDVAALITRDALRDHQKVIRVAERGVNVYYSAAWDGASRHPFGAEYVCRPRSIA